MNKCKVVNTATGIVVLESKTPLYLNEGENFNHNGSNFVVTGRVDNAMEGSDQVKTFYVRPAAESDGMMDLRERI